MRSLQLRASVAAAGLLVTALAASGAILSDPSRGIGEAGYVSSPVVRATNVPLVVAIDVNPFYYPNVIYKKSRMHLVPVAIWTTNSYNALSIKPTSCRLAGAAPANYKSLDVDRDGDLDLVLYFWNTKMAITLSTTSVTLTGLMNDGTPIVGSDTCVVKP